MLIGKGACCEVFFDGKYAIKVFNSDSAGIALKEILVMKYLANGKYIQTFVDYRIVGDRVELIQERADCDLLQWRQGRHVRLHTMQRIARNVLLGLTWLHVNELVHGDIKPDNILIFTDRGVPTAKLCDFGMVSLNGTNTRYGTKTYCMPDVLHKCAHVTMTCDIWAYGLTMIYLYTGQLAEDNPIMECRAVKLLRKEITNTNLAYVIYSCLTNQPTVFQLLECPGIWGRTTEDRKWRSDLLTSRAKSTPEQYWHMINIPLHQSHQYALAFLTAFS
jgi:serine/threonine protein kinase